MNGEKIRKRVHHYYHDENFNCATTMLKILAESYNIKLDKQVLEAAVGMHGAGKYRAQCGLVEGAIMFIGIYGGINEYKKSRIVNHCYDFAAKFDKKFGSLVCKDLRPEGFKPENPPHLCEELTVEAAACSDDFIKKFSTG